MQTVFVVFFAFLAVLFFEMESANLPCEATFSTHGIEVIFGKINCSFKSVPGRRSIFLYVGIACNRPRPSFCRDQCDLLEDNTVSGSLSAE